MLSFWQHSTPPLRVNKNPQIILAVPTDFRASGHPLLRCKVPTSASFLLSPLVRRGSTPSSPASRDLRWDEDMEGDQELLS